MLSWAMVGRGPRTYNKRIVTNNKVQNNNKCINESNN
jgi:hypothetical protein